LERYERLSAETAADFSPDALASATQALRDSIDAHAAKVAVLQTRTDRVKVLQDIVARLQGEAKATAQATKDALDATLNDYLFNDVALAAAAVRYHQASIAAPVVSAGLLLLGTTLLPQAELARQAADVDALYGRALAIEAEAKVRMIKRLQASQELIELEGGSIELVTGTGATAEAVRMAVSAFAIADSARTELETAQQRFAQQHQ
jgi:hypothetical protein